MVFIHVNATAAKNYAIFLALFEIVAIARHFVLGHSFTDIVGFFGDAPGQMEQGFFWLMISFLALMRLLFAANHSVVAWSEINATIHVLEIPLIGGIIVAYHWKVFASLSCATLSSLTALQVLPATTKAAVAIYIAIVANAFFFYQYADSCAIDAFAAAAPSRRAKGKSASAASLSSVERAPTPPPKKKAVSATPKRSTSSKTKN